MAKQGYYIFFPDYQKSDYPNFPKDTETYSDNRTLRATFRYWLFDVGVLLITLILRQKINTKELKKLIEDGILVALRFILGTLFFVVVINIVFLFNREYGKNLISMITTVIASLRSAPIEWLKQSVETTEIG